MLDYGRVITQCNHGCVLMIPDGNHPVAIFIDAFFIDCLFGEGSSLAEGKGKHVVDNLSDSFGTQLAVWNDDSHRKMAKDLLLGIGTIMILGNEEKILTVPKEIAYAVIVLENYDGNGDIDSTMTTRYVSTKARDLRSPRDVLKFYRKRLSCSCLKNTNIYWQGKLLQRWEHATTVDRQRTVQCYRYAVNAEFLNTVQGIVKLQIGLSTRSIVILCVRRLMLINAAGKMTSCEITTYAIRGEEHSNPL